MTKFSPAVQAELQRQFNHEFTAAHAYVAMAVWCEDAGLKGCGKFFRKQAAEEREHADKFMAHLADRGVKPELAAVAAPKTKFESLVEVAEHALAMEVANTTGISKCYDVAVAEHDLASQPMLMWFIKEQVEEEAWASDLVRLAKGANCSGALMDLDRHVIKYLTSGEE